jgi:hypothetical protein
VKAFLLGLRVDLHHDVSETRENLKAYAYFGAAYAFLANLKQGVKADMDSLNTYVKIIHVNFFLRPDISRFEGFKSSGGLQEINDHPLLQDILDFYEQAIPQLETSENGWLGLQQSLKRLFLDEQIDYGDGTNNAYQILIEPKAHNLCKALIPWPQLLERYDVIIQLANKITDEINHDYPDQ